MTSSFDLPSLWVMGLVFQAGGDRLVGRVVPAWLSSLGAVAPRSPCSKVDHAAKSTIKCICILNFAGKKTQHCEIRFPKYDPIAPFAWPQADAG